MDSSNITKTGQLILNIDNMHYLINNFSKTNTLTDWTFGTNTFANGTVTLTGTAPAITSSVFTVNPDDIICFEFTVSLPTPSTTTSGPGLYLGTQYGQSVYVHSFNHNTKTWTQSTSANTNPYFLYNYNLTAVLTLKNYILGSNVNLNNVPYGETTNTSYPARAIQLPSGTTTTYIRSGYNSNTSMVINFSNPQIYYINQKGFYDSNDVNIANIGKGYSQAFQFIEY